MEVVKEKYGVDVVFFINELNKKLFEYLKKVDKIYYCLGCDCNFNEIVFKYW